MTVSEAVKELRQALGGITQERFARNLGVTWRTVARWESPMQNIPVMTLSTLRSIAVAAKAKNSADCFESKIREKLGLDLLPSKPAKVKPSTEPDGADESGLWQ